MYRDQASFTVTLDIPSHLMALSNMPVVNEKISGLVKTVYFQKSPLMSTYLVAVVIGQFDHIERHTSDGTTLLPLINTHNQENKS